MKRFAPIIFTIALTVGVFAPVALSVTLPSHFQLQTTHAQGKPTITPIDSSLGDGSLDGTGLDPKAAGADAEKNSGNSPYDKLEPCSVIIYGTLTGCLEHIVYFVPYYLGGLAMATAGNILDASAALVISSKLYVAGESFLSGGWKVTRDIANIFFIFILLAAALGLVLGIDIGHASPKKLVGMVVIIAILINFSFFLTEVVIDLSNSMALVFYNQTNPVKGALSVGPANSDQVNQLTIATPEGSDIVTRPLSIGLIQSFKPQYLNSPDFYNKLPKDSNDSTYEYGAMWHNIKTGISNTVGIDVTQFPKPSIIISLLIMIGAMYLVVAYSFFIAALSLIGRLISLWIAIIFAPFAFVSFIIPAARKIPGFGWDEWLKNLMKSAFAAPIYFFFLFLIMKLAGVSIVPGADKLKDNSVSAGVIILLIVVQAAIIITLLLKATKYVKEASGEIGAMVMKAAKLAGGVALGAAGLAASGAFAGIAVLGQGSIGGYGKKLLNDKDLLDKAKNGDRVAIAKLKAAKMLTTSSFNMGNTKVMGGIRTLAKKATGMEMPLMTKGFGMIGGRDFATAGGLEGALHRKEARNEKMKALLSEDKDKKERIVNAIDDRKDNQIQANADYAKAKAAEMNDSTESIAAKAAIDGAKATLQTAKDDLAALQQLNAPLNEIQDAKDAIVHAKSALDGLMNDKRIRQSSTQAATAYKNGLDAGEEEFKGKGINDVKSRSIDAAGNLVEIKYTEEEAMKGMSLAELERSLTANENARFKEYLLSESLKSRAHVDPNSIKYNELGDLKKFHVDTRQMTKNFGQSLKEGFKGAGIGLAVGGAVGAVVAGIPGAITLGLTGLAGYLRDTNRRLSAEAAHHAMEKMAGRKTDEGGKHDDHSKDETFVSNLKKVFTDAANVMGAKISHAAKSSGGDSHGSGHH